MVYIRDMRLMTSYIYFFTTVFCVSYVTSQNTSFDCTFETDLCNMTLFDPPGTPTHWMRSTPNQLLAQSLTALPRKDHTINSADGHFMFFDGSITATFKHKSRLKVYNLTATNSYGSCVRFSYSIFGTTGKLLLYTDMCGNVMYVWKTSKNTWFDWHTVAIPLEPWIREFDLIFEAERYGSGDVGISLDDVTFTDSPCEIPTTTAYQTTVPTTEETTPSTTTLECPTTQATTPQRRTDSPPECPADFCDQAFTTCKVAFPIDGFFCSCGSISLNQVCYREFVAKPLLPYGWAIPTSLLLLLIILVLILVIIVCRRRQDVKLFWSMQRSSQKFYENGNPINHSTKVSIQSDVYDGGPNETETAETDLDDKQAYLNDNRMNVNDMTLSIDFDGLPLSSSQEQD